MPRIAESQDPLGRVVLYHFSPMSAIHQQRRTSWPRQTLVHQQLRKRSWQVVVCECNCTPVDLRYLFWV
jgi:hypothetical protein